MTKTKIYVAARYARRTEAAVTAMLLRSSGFIVVSTWHDGEKDDIAGDYTSKEEGKMIDLAIKDMQEVSDANIVLSLTEPAGSTNMGGSRHVEFAMGYAWGKTCVLIGQKELLFHRLPGVLQFDTIYDCINDWEKLQADLAKIPSGPVVRDWRGPIMLEQSANDKSIYATTAAERKAAPLCTGVLDYFPDALMEIARVSKKGNDQHNPGEPLHWAKEKSTDHADAMLRHQKDRGKLDTDGQRHSAKVAWRALAQLQVELENEEPDARDCDIQWKGSI